jgi:hypothetical protein
MTLKEQAEELGIKVDGRWSESRIQEEIDKALADGDSNQNESADSDMAEQEEKNYQTVDDKDVFAGLNAERQAKAKAIRDAK